MNFCLTVDDVGYDGFSTEDHLSNLLDAFQRMDIRATFFTVPISRGAVIHQRQGYVDLLRRAVREGHEIAQHGLKHDRFEVGIPPPMIMEMSHEGPARRRLATQRDAIDASLQKNKIRARLRKGRRILEEASNTEIVGFRSPCLAVCENLFHALGAEAYQYDSSLHLQDAGWDILNGKEPVKFRPIDREDFLKKQHPGSLLSFPLTTEYTWYLPWSRFDITFSLAKHDFVSCLQANIPFVTLSHVSPIQEGEENAGLEFYERLLAFAAEKAGQIGRELCVTTLSELCRTAESRNL